MRLRLRRMGCTLPMCIRRQPSRRRRWCATSSGKVVVEVAKQDITKLKAMGWVPPIPITVKARDGKTDVYGYMFKPTDFDASKKYPIVNNVYPGPQTGSCGESRVFGGASGLAVAGGAWVHRGVHRWDGDAVEVKGVS